MNAMMIVSLLDLMSIQNVGCNFVSYTVFCLSLVSVKNYLLLVPQVKCYLIKAVCHQANTKVMERLGAEWSYFRKFFS